MDSLVALALTVQLISSVLKRRRPNWVSLQYPTKLCIHVNTRESFCCCFLIVWSWVSRDLWKKMMFKFTHYSGPYKADWSTQCIFKFWAVILQQPGERVSGAIMGSQQGGIVKSVESCGGLRQSICRFFPYPITPPSCPFSTPCMHHELYTTLSNKPQARLYTRTHPGAHR